MNLDLHVKNEILPMLPDIVEGTVVYPEMGQTVSSFGLSSLQKMLQEIGPLPEEALFLGRAEDGLPILLNLWDPQPGPILVAADTQAGRTEFLKTITRFVASTHRARQIQFGVITSRPDQWDGYEGDPHCVGVFSPAQRGVTDFIRALAVWIEVHQTTRQSVLLLIDGLDDFLTWNSGLGHALQKILVKGPAKRIWPVVTSSPHCCQNLGPWLDYFHTRVIGYTHQAGATLDDGYPLSSCTKASRRVEFSMKQKSQWIKFHIPGM